MSLLADYRRKEIIPTAHTEREREHSSYIIDLERERACFSISVSSIRK